MAHRLREFQAATRAELHIHRARSTVAADQAAGFHKTRLTMVLQQGLKVADHVTSAFWASSLTASLESAFVTEQALSSPQKSTFLVRNEAAYSCDLAGSKRRESRQ
jgi:hypothetical protein